MKLDLSGEAVTRIMGDGDVDVNDVQLPWTTDPMELSKVKHIVDQLVCSATDLELEVFTNTATISAERRNFSKYHLSRPDTVVLPCTVIGSRVKNKWLLTVNDNESDNEEENSESELRARFKNVFLDAEIKRSQAICKDPIGQLLAAMDKTLADRISSSLSTASGIVIKTCTIYGLYILPETDMCEVYKVDVTLGKPTSAVKGIQKLGVSDAINRVIKEMVS